MIDVKGGVLTSWKVKGGHSYRETLAVFFLFDSGALSSFGGVLVYINELLASLTFSEDESKRVVSNTRLDSEAQSYEAWAVGKLMSKRKANKKAMYQVLKSLWFTKELVYFVAMTEGQKMEDYVFHIVPFWIRVYNIPFEGIDRQVAINVGEVVGELFTRLGMRELKFYVGLSMKDFLLFAISMVALGIVHRSAFNKMRYQLESIWVKSWMASCLGVDIEGRKGGLAIMWKDGIEVTILNNCSHHIDSLVKLDDSTSLRFTGFYGFAKLNLHGHSWDLLKSIGEFVRENCIVSGNFNAILNDSDKSEGRRKSRVDMEDF
ncbi:reverse transcriptase [Gossypium australe]|uniref:Reverse transcriptase n=1 Tax=Gossypium australe TaxID=47621 RepID=A0A5B6VWW9_9ROSI|nr:reverse transcriptase [Gossypium australe]